MSKVAWLGQPAMNLGWRLSNEFSGHCSQAYTAHSPVAVMRNPRGPKAEDKFGRHAEGQKQVLHRTIATHRQHSASDGISQIEQCDERNGTVLQNL